MIYVWDFVENIIVSFEELSGRSELILSKYDWKWTKFISLWCDSFIAKGPLWFVYRAKHIERVQKILMHQRKDMIS